MVLPVSSQSLFFRQTMRMLFSLVGGVVGEVVVEVEGTEVVDPIPMAHRMRGLRRQTLLVGTAKS